MPLQELIAIQANGPKDIGFFGTRNMGFSHQNLVEILSYAMVLTVRLSAAGKAACEPCLPPEMTSLQVTLCPGPGDWPKARPAQGCRAASSPDRRHRA